MPNTIKVPFNRALQRFLAEQGYTHLYNKGVEDTRMPIIDDTNIDYVVIPLKPDDLHFREEAIAEKIEELRSDEVFDMADGDRLINFILELPADVYEQFLKS